MEPPVLTFKYKNVRLLLLLSVIHIALAVWNHVNYYFHFSLSKTDSFVIRIFGLTLYYLIIALAGHLLAYYKEKTAICISLYIYAAFGVLSFLPIYVFDYQLKSMYQFHNLFMIYLEFRGLIIFCITVTYLAFTYSIKNKEFAIFYQFLGWTLLLVQVLNYVNPLIASITHTGYNNFKYISYISFVADILLIIIAVKANSISDKVPDAQNY